MSTGREEFEAAMAREGYHSNPQVYRDGTYRDSEYAAGWAMWQAGRAAQAAAVKVPTAWMDPKTLDVVHASRKASWESDYGAGGKIRASTYTVPLVAAATANTPTPGDAK